MATHPSAKLTYQDYARFPDDGMRRQLIDGEVHVVPAPNTRHQDNAGKLFRRIGNHLEEHGGGRVFVAPYDVVLSPNDVVQPDIVFVADEHRSRITQANLQGPPTLAIEVLSDARLDRRLKRDLYERFGVPEYWIVDPDGDLVEVYRLRADRYGKAEILSPGDTLITPLLPGLAIDIEDLLAR